MKNNNKQWLYYSQKPICLIDINEIIDYIETNVDEKIYDFSFDVVDDLDGYYVIKFTTKNISKINTFCNCIGMEIIEEKDNKFFMVGLYTSSSILIKKFNLTVPEGTMEKITVEAVKLDLEELKKGIFKRID